MSTNDKYPRKPLTDDPSLNEMFNGDDVLFAEAEAPDPYATGNAMSAETRTKLLAMGYMNPEQMEPGFIKFALSDPDMAKREARVAGYKGVTYAELKDRPPPKSILRTSTCIVPYGLTEIFGKPGVGKSLYAIELTICAAAGVPFHGAPLDIGRRHLYLAAEGGSGIGGRIAEVLKRRKISESDIGGWVVVEKPVDLQDPKTIDAVFKANPGPWDTVTIDTLAQSMTGDENSTQDMSAVVRELKRIRDRYCPNVFLIHHEGRHADHARGAIAMDAATDCQLRVYIDGDGQTCVEVKRLRDYGRPQNSVTRFKLKDGLLEPATAGVGDREDRMLALLVTLCVDEEDGIEPTLWREACDAKGLLDAPTDDGKGTQWKRALARLKLAKRIKITGKTSAARVAPLPPQEFADDFEA